MIVFLYFSLIKFPHIALELFIKDTLDEDANDIGLLRLLIFLALNAEIILIKVYVKKNSYSWAVVNNDEWFASKSENWG